MDTSTIGNMKATIRAEYESRIKTLQTEMATVIASLTAAEKTFGFIDAKLDIGQTGIPDGFVRPTRPVRPIASVSHEEGKAPSAKARILNQKNILHGRYRRKQLYDAVINDGYGEIPIGTFSLPFSVLAKNGEIVEIEKGTGNAPSMYMWKEEVTDDDLSTPLF